MSPRVFLLHSIAILPRQPTFLTGGCELLDIKFISGLVFANDFTATHVLFEDVPRTAGLLRQQHASVLLSQQLLYLAHGFGTT
jgi:hypothetical protein